MVALGLVGLLAGMLLRPGRVNRWVLALVGFFSHSGVRPGGGFEHGFNDGDGLYLACGAGGVCLRRTF